MKRYIKLKQGDTVRQGTLYISFKPYDKAVTDDSFKITESFLKENKCYISTLNHSSYNGKTVLQMRRDCGNGLIFFHEHRKRKVG